MIRGGLLVLALALAARPAWSWGERAHHAIARSAALHGTLGARASSDEDKRLLAGFDRLLRARALQLGHLSNIPDTAWRSMDGTTQKLNAPTHFIDADLWTTDFDALPLDYGEAKARIDGKPSRVDGRPISLWEMGTLPWRAQQLYELAVGQWKRAKAAETAKEYHWAVHDALTYSGLLAHFIADASMPSHNTLDNDGWSTGNGGIHAFFESVTPLAATPELELELWREVPAAFEEFRVDFKFGSGLGRPAALLARELGKDAYAKLPELRRLDDSLIRERSRAEPTRSAAVRRAPEEALPVFRPLILRQAALSAAALARLWRGAWEEGGRPDVERALSSHHYAHRPPFPDPDYDLEAVRRIRGAAALRPRRGRGSGARAGDRPRLRR